MTKEDTGTWTWGGEIPPAMGRQKGTSSARTARNKTRDERALSWMTAFIGKRETGLRRTPSRECAVAAAGVHSKTRREWVGIWDMGSPAVAATVAAVAAAAAAAAIFVPRHAVTLQRDAGSCAPPGPPRDTKEHQQNHHSRSLLGPGTLPDLLSSARPTCHSSAIFCRSSATLLPAQSRVSRRHASLSPERSPGETLAAMAIMTGSSLAASAHQGAVPRPIRWPSAASRGENRQGGFLLSAVRLLGLLPVGCASAAAEDLRARVFIARLKMKQPADEQNSAALLPRKPTAAAAAAATAA
ncbi:hypothetical protein AOQ84DRAFT_409247 [Glonium stellatum]|uniref:Uncharacterized protein n=1 Tax=Glonium stellatum TaxID=574774 RepID=A0A8E2EZ45_9PEZI|nr:hypothetical protein AOQ84DRAFT_409247 [Glonium stellatum]